MNIYAISGAVNTVSVVLLGAIVYFNNRRSEQNISFAVFCFFIGVWSFLYFVWHNSVGYDARIFWCKGNMSGAIFIPVSFLHFTLYFLDLYRKKKKIVVGGYVLFSIFFFINLFTSLITKGASQKLSFSYWPDAGPLFTPFLIVWGIFCIYPCILLHKALGSSTGNRRNQIKYVLAGIIIGYGSGSTNYFLWYDIPILPVGNFLVPLFVGLIAYSIYKYQLMDIRVAITRTSIFLFVYTVILGLPFLFAKITDLWGWALVLTSVLAFLGPFMYRYLRKEVEEILLKQNKDYQKSLQNYAAAEQIRRHKTMDHFSASLAHEIQNPIFAIEGMAQVIQNQLDHELKEYIPNEQSKVLSRRLDRLTKDTARVSKIIKAIREFASQTKGDFDIVKVEELIEDYMSIVRHQFKYKEVDLIKDIEPNLTIYGNKIHLEEVLINLATNAIHAVEGNSGDKKVTLKISKNTPKTILIELSDNGYGVKAKLLNDIFLNFVTTKASTEASGLGLARVRKIVENHNGKIWARSDGEGRGASFFVELPIQN